MRMHTRLLAFWRFRWAMVFILLNYFVHSNAFGQPAGPDQDLLKRNWKDSSGLFVVEAVLIEVGLNSVKLRQIDGSVYEAQRGNLSAVDQEFVKSIEKSRSPFVALNLYPNKNNFNSYGIASDEKRVVALPLKNNSTPVLPSSQNVVLYAPTTKPAKITTVPQSLLSVEPGEVFISESNGGGRISPLLVLDIVSKTVAISLEANRYSEQAKPRGQIYVGKMPSGPFKAIMDVESPITLLDHNLESGQTLAVCHESGETGDRDLVILEGLKGEKPVEKCRYRLPVDRNERRTVSQGMLVGKDQAVIVIEGIIHCWDLSNGTQIYQSDPTNPLQQKIEFSDDRRLMAVVQSTGFQLADPKTGKDFGFVALNRPFQGQMRFDPFGNRIAFCNQDAWGYYDYEKRTMRDPETTTWKLYGQILGWVSPELLLAGDGTLLHTEKGIPVWRYRPRWSGDCRIWNDSITFVENQNGLKLRTIPMPHEPLKNALAELPNVKDLLLTQKGAKVRLLFELPDPLPLNVNADALRDKMRQIVRNASWEIDDDSPLHLVVKMSPGKPFKTRHASMNVDTSKSMNMRLENSEVEITPMVSRLELRVRDKLVWYIESMRPRESYSTSASTFKQGVSKAEFIQQMQSARPEFFDGICLPTRIPRPPYTFGFGTSSDSSGTWLKAPDFLDYSSFTGSE